MLQALPAMSAALAPIAQFTAETVHEAAGLSLEIATEQPTPQLTKANSSVVTIADFAVQAVMARRLLDRFPGDAFVAEEGAESWFGNTDFLNQVVAATRLRVTDADRASVLRWIRHGQGQIGERGWIADPVDGTSGFISKPSELDPGIDQFANNLAFVLGGQVMVSAIAYPRLRYGDDLALRAGILCLAVRGHGAWWAPLFEAQPFQPLKVSDRSGADLTRLRSMGAGRPLKPRPKDLFDRLLAFHGITAEPIYSRGPVKYFHVAAGQGDFFQNIHLPGSPPSMIPVWDHAAGSLLVEEAGGRVTDWRGRPLDFTAGRTLLNNAGYLVSSGPFHELALRDYRRIFPLLVLSVPFRSWLPNIFGGRR